MSFISRLNIEPLTPIQKYILIGIFSSTVVLFYVLRNLYYISLGGPPFLDISTFHAAAEAVFTGKVSPYNIEVLKIYKAADLVTIYPFLYLPSAIPFFYPMAGHDFALTYQATLYINSVLIVGLVIGLAFWTLRLTNSFWAALLMIPVLTEGSRGLLATLWYGQINAIIAALLLAALWCLTRQKKAAAGILLGVTSTIKLYPAILLPWLAIRRDWVTLGWSVGTILGLIALSWLWLPHYLWTEWFNKVAVYGYGTQPPGLMLVSLASNLNINGLLMRSLSNPVLIKVLAYGSCIALLAATLYTAYKRPAPLTAHFAAFIWLTLIIAPVTWLSHLTYAMFAVVWFLAMAWVNRQYVWCLIVAVTYGVVLQLTQTEFAVPLWRSALPCAGLILIWGMMQYQIWRNNSAGSGAAAG